MGCDRFTLTPISTVFPQEYAAFVKRQYEIAESEKRGRKVVMPDAGVCIKAAVASVPTTRATPPGRVARGPLPPELRSGQLIYINLVSHTAVLPPTLVSDQRSILDVEKSGGRGSVTLATMLNLEIPLAFSDPRPVKGTGE